ncbi:MAG TPA: hypothetical protein VGZ00_12155 [Candidatus Baltobacteraceae bacterium]|nr:hypothetical protein [Candidatus Baltobacteraceae bacterium]
MQKASDFAPRLREFRLKLGCTQDEIAEQLIRLAHDQGQEVNVNATMISTWERGKKKPRKYYRHWLCTLYQTTEEFLGFKPFKPGAVVLAADNAKQAQDSFLVGQHEIMEFFQILSLADTAIVLSSLREDADVDIERITHSAEHPSRIDDAALDEYARLNASLWTEYCSATQKRTVFDQVRRQTQVLVRCLHESQRILHRERLMELLGSLLQLAGEIFFDANRYADALRTYSVATTACKETNSFDLFACALTRQAFVWIFERQFHEALAVLEFAEQLAQRGDPALSTRYWVSAVTAQTHAALGNQAECSSALDAADQVQLLSNQGTSGWLRFTEKRLAEERGTCFVKLGRSDDAEESLTQALVGVESPRRRGMILTDLALAAIQRKQVDSACAYGQAVVELARQSASGVVRTRLRELSRALSPFADAIEVRRLNDHISSLDT